LGRADGASIQPSIVPVDRPARNLVAHRRMSVCSPSAHGRCAAAASRRPASSLLMPGPRPLTCALRLGRPHQTSRNAKLRRHALSPARWRVPHDAGRGPIQSVRTDPRRPRACKAW
jgi:hypothetical protein